MKTFKIFIPLLFVLFNSCEKDLFNEFDYTPEDLSYFVECINYTLHCNSIEDDTEFDISMCSAFNEYRLIDHYYYYTGDSARCFTYDLDSLKVGQCFSGDCVYKTEYFDSLEELYRKYGYKNRRCWFIQKNELKKIYSENEFQYEVESDTYFKFTKEEEDEVQVREYWFDEKGFCTKYKEQVTVYRGESIFQSASYEYDYNYELF